MNRRSLILGLGSTVHGFRRMVAHLWALEARLRGVQLDGSVTFSGRPILEVQPGATMRIGRDCRIQSSPRSTPLGNAQPCVLRTLVPGAQLIIGDRVAMSSTIICAAQSVTIGEGTTCGAGAMIIDTDFHEQAETWDWRDNYAGLAKPIAIGRGCFIGARAIILKGVTIGDRAVIGAGAIVTADVPAGAVAAGNPARIIRAAAMPT
jgi:acetyltransferase-like isoleucine patch superfamily enzyme